jgi:amidohydrolase
MKSENFKKELIKIRRQIHKYPELGNREYRTTGLIERRLKSLDIKTKKITRTGLVGILKGNGQKSTKCIALRADIDALPVMEQTDKPYKSSRPGIMHACGHDAHTTMLLGAAMKLVRLKDKLNGTVKFIFQPDEESVSGAEQMIDAGVLKNPQVSTIVGMHVDTQIPAGVLGVKYGKMMAAVDKFEIDIYGGGGHAAYPHKCKDTVVCASEIIQSLQSLVARELDPVEPVVVSICTINGGTRFNVITDRIVMTGTVRLLDKSLHKQIFRLMHKHISGIAGSHGLKFKFNYEIVGHPVVNDKSMVDFSINSGKKVTGVKLIDKPSMGGEDFSEYLRYVKGCFLNIGSRRKNNNYPWHHPKFDIDENILHVGAGVLTQIALDYLE